MKISVIKYNAGNIRSVAFALERLNINFEITDDHEKIKSADKVIFPGVGEASSTMKYLKDNKLDQLIVGLRQPVLGICLGMQLMCRHSEENNTTCLCIFDEQVKKFTADKDHKVPHMGWNSLQAVNDWLPSSLENQFVYFVHSFYVPVGSFTSASTDYITKFSSAMRKDNFYAAQFHPEKSADVGKIVLESFLKKS
ncbi:MAG TPA: imidazole glycerol phosphate synthase subunit HisH [Cyclobacteriaceae bacterium]|nr:imidazole glycerol phosphate synthase subunit HisH [Cyclobacteriaceae bacterium]